MAALFGCKTITQPLSQTLVTSTPQTVAAFPELTDALHAVQQSWANPAFLPADCQQVTSLIQIPQTPAADAVLQGCIVHDDASHPVLAVLNPNHFYIQIQSQESGWDYPTPQILNPGERVEFTAQTNDPSPLIVTSSSSPLVHLHNLVDLLLSLFPGGHVIGSQTEVVQCIAKSEQSVPDLVIAAQALSQEDAASAARAITRLFQDSGLGSRWIQTAQDCQASSASTWTVEGLLAAGQAMQNQQSLLMDVLTTLILPNQANLQFIWQRPVTTLETPLATIPPDQSAVSGTLETALMGYSTDYSVRYDPEIWEAQWAEISPQRKVVTLQHRLFNDCTLTDNLGHGVPPSWDFSRDHRTIGTLDFSVETWTERSTNQITLRVYAFADNIRLELAPGTQQEGCIAAAEQVLAQSADELSTAK